MTAFTQLCISYCSNSMCFYIFHIIKHFRNVVYNIVIGFWQTLRSWFGLESHLLFGTTSYTDVIIAYWIRAWNSSGSNSYFCVFLYGWHGFWRNVIFHKCLQTCGKLSEVTVQVKFHCKHGSAGSWRGRPK